MMGEACSTHGKYEKWTRNFVRQPEGKRPLGRPRCRWEGDITMYLRGIWYEVVDWMHLAQDMDQ